MVLVEPGVKVDRIEPDQPADPHHRDAPLVNESTDVSHARVEPLGDALSAPLLSLTQTSCHIRATPDGKTVILTVPDGESW